MGSIVGFTLSSDLLDSKYLSASNAQDQAILSFKWLETKTLVFGQTRLDIWGHTQINDCIYRLSDGSHLFLIGSPTPKIPWQDIEKSLQYLQSSYEFEFPWDGRAILVKVSADGNQWNIWNDWVGSIPVFYSKINKGIILSTLETAVVSASGYSKDDYFLPGLVSLFIHGHLMGEWTLYKQMKTVPGDCVINWDNGSLHLKQQFSVQSNQNNWETSWDELVDLMYELSRNAIAGVLKTQPNWLIPLSGGLDSRLIAGVAAQEGINAYTYSWGEYRTFDSIYAEQIAKTLDLPWKLIHFNKEYLVQHTRSWANLFGSSMNFHGIHLIAFLDQLKYEPQGKICLGFMGETLVGYEVRFQNNLHSPTKRTYQHHPDGYLFIPPKEGQDLFNLPIGEALEEIADEIDRQRQIAPGSWFQRLRFFTFWGRQRLFTSFQSTLCDYWRGVATPFLNRSYARFCLSLPRAVLDNRRLQMDMFKRWYPKLASIHGTYESPTPILLTEDYVIKRKIAFRLPMPLRLGPLKQFTVFDNPRNWFQACLQEYGKASLWPIWESWQDLGEWINLQKVESAFERALLGDSSAMNVLRSVQMLAYRLFENQ